MRQQGAAVTNFVCIQLHSLNMSTAKTDRSRSRTGLICAHSRRVLTPCCSVTGRLSRKSSARGKGAGQLDLLDSCVRHPVNSSSPPRGARREADHVLGHKASLNRYGRLFTQSLSLATGRCSRNQWQRGDTTLTSSVRG